MPEAKILAVNGRSFSMDGLKDAVADARGVAIEITVDYKGVVQQFSLQYNGGLRYPHLERITGTPDLLSELGRPRRKS
jgi:hypothetical protein